MLSMLLKFLCSYVAAVWARLRPTALLVAAAAAAAALSISCGRINGLSYCHICRARADVAAAGSCPASRCCQRLKIVIVCLAPCSSISRDRFQLQCLLCRHTGLLLLLLLLCLLLLCLLLICLLLLCLLLPRMLLLVPMQL
jgi:hypothetical protein